MRSTRCRIATIVAAAIAFPCATRATDQIIDFECVGTGYDAHFVNTPNPITIEAGADRVEFRTGSYETMLPCAAAANSPSIEISLWGGPSAYLWYTESVIARGPFCEPGDYTYPITLRGSNGTNNGSLPPGTIHVTPPASGPLPATITIGVFAERDGGTCVLPSTPGPHRAYVCARSHDFSPLGIAAAEFRIGGFPAAWNVTATPEFPVSGGEGDPLGSGVRLRAGGCYQPAVHDRAVLYSLDYTVPQSGGEATIEVLPALQFGHSRPWLVRCDEQSVYQECVLGGLASAGGTGVPCAVAVTSKSWSDVRLLYR